MKPEAQRIAIAEACGIKPPFKVECKGKWIVQNIIWTIPNYLSDLNAMHEAEKVLTHPQWNQYYDRLAQIAGTRGGIRATASQRAEAFLRTKGLWREDV